MPKYNKKEYLKYVKKLQKSTLKDDEGKKIKLKPISYRKWKEFQPIADKAVGLVNKIIIRKE